MAVFEHDPLMQYKDVDGDWHILYPVTKAENVIGGVHEVSNPTNGNLPMLTTDGQLVDSGKPSTGLVYTKDLASSGELLLNRSFEIMERAKTTITLSGVWQYLFDRWAVAGSGTCSQVQINTIPNVPTCMCIAFNSTNFVRVAQYTESLTGGKLSLPLVMSFWIYSANGGVVERNGEAISVTAGKWTKIVFRSSVAANFDVILRGTGWWYLGDPRLGPAYDERFVPENVPLARAACTRYYTSIKNILLSTTAFDQSFDLGLYMRTTPSIKTVSSAGTVGYISQWVGSGYQDVVPIFADPITSRTVRVAYTGSSHTVYYFSLLADAEYYG